MSHDSMPARPAEHHCDVLVIGGGPAGSTAATLLAEKGHQVPPLEKAHHPRFDIGESLLPANLPLKRTVTAWKRRKLNLHPLEEAEGAGCR